MEVRSSADLPAHRIASESQTVLHEHNQVCTQTPVASACLTLFTYSVNDLSQQSCSSMPEVSPH